MSIHTHKLVVNISEAGVNEPVLLPLTSEEIAILEARDAAWEAEAPARLLTDVREKRNALLKESDYVAMPDHPLANNLDWKQYRQALRDVPQQPDLTNIQWPTKPGA